MADNSPSWGTPSAPSSPTISDYNGSERNADDHNTLETNLEVHYFYHKPNLIIYYSAMLSHVTLDPYFYTAGIKIRDRNKK